MNNYNVEDIVILVVIVFVAVGIFALGYSLGDAVGYDRAFKAYLEAR